MTKLSQLSSADSLSGYETIATVQGGRNVQSRILPISNLNSTSVRIGYYAQSNGEATIAIGAYSEAGSGYGTVVVGHAALGTSDSVVVGVYAYAISGVAIGNNCFSSGLKAIAIGQYAEASHINGIAIGCYLEAGSEAVAMGFEASTHNSDFSIAIGRESSTFSGDRAYGSYRAIAIGYQSYVVGFSGIAIGVNAHSNYRCVAIGAQVGTYRQSGVRNVNIGGRYNYSRFNYCTAVGYYASNYIGERATAIGGYAFTNSDHASALGDSQGFGPSSTAIGGSRARQIVTTSIGAGAGAYYGASMVLGTNFRDRTAGSLVFGGFNTGPLPPTQHFLKFIGQTTAPVNTTVQFTVGSSNITVTGPPNFDGAGFAIMANPSPTDHVSAATGSDLTIYLATDSEGFLINVANHLSDIAALFPFEGFTFEFTGPDIALDTPFVTNFSGGSDGSLSALTVDGASVTGSNTIVLRHGAAARVTGRVVAATPPLFASSGDVASFLLEPITVYRQYDGIYIFVGDPTFTMENSTDGASAWPVPELVTDGNDYLYITVNNTDVALLHWMAHVTLETNN